MAGSPGPRMVGCGCSGHPGLGLGTQPGKVLLVGGQPGREGCTQGWRTQRSAVLLSFSPAHGGARARRPPPACAVLLAPGLLSLRGLTRVNRAHEETPRADAVHSPDLASGAKAASLTTTVI